MTDLNMTYHLVRKRGLELLQAGELGRNLTSLLHLALLLRTAKRLQDRGSIRLRRLICAAFYNTVENTSHVFAS